MPPFTSVKSVNLQKSGKKPCAVTDKEDKKAKQREAEIFFNKSALNKLNFKKNSLILCPKT